LNKPKKSCKKKKLSKVGVGRKGSLREKGMEGGRKTKKKTKSNGIGCIIKYLPMLYEYLY
jgi:hypothetical protein